METYSNQLDILDISNINAMESILSLLNIRQRFSTIFQVQFNLQNNENDTSIKN